jgi:hypothetical protein
MRYTKGKNNYREEIEKESFPTQGEGLKGKEMKQGG